MFKKLLFIIILISFSLVLKAQILVQKIPDQNLTAIDGNFMQQGFKLAYSNLSSEDYLFKGREEEWKKSWIALMHALNNYMQKKGLQFTSSSSCFNRIYFNQEGNITAYLYQVSGLSTEQEKLFDDHIFQFLLTQKMNIKANQNYWQYGNLKFE